MKKWAFPLIVSLIGFASAAETNATAEANTSAAGTTNPDQLAKHVQEQMKREEHFAKTQSFAQGDDYNLSEHQVDPKDLENVQVDPPMYDFDMNDVYSD